MSGSSSEDPLFFESGEALIAWMETHFTQQEPVWLGFYKPRARILSLTYAEMQDILLCYGWSEFRTRSRDEMSYAVCCGPRKKGSTWSDKNIVKAQEMIRLGVMHPNGQRMFESRKKHAESRFSYEQKGALAFPPELAALLHAAPRAEAWLATMPPSYRKAAVWWVISAKQEATRLRRMQELVAHCDQGKKLPRFISPTGKKRSSDA